MRAEGGMLHESSRPGAGFGLRVRSHNNEDSQRREGELTAALYILLTSAQW